MERIERNDDQSRYQLWFDDQLASIAEFVVKGDRVVFTHTETIPAFQGRGFAEQLVRWALADVDAQQRTPVGQCWFVREIMGRTVA